MSFQKFGQKAILHYYRTLCRIQHFNRVINIFEYMHNASQVLLCLPNEKAGCEAVSDYFPSLGKIFPGATVFLLVEENLTAHEIPEIFQILHYNSSGLNFWGSPRDVLDKIKRNRFDVVIDTSRAFNFINTSAAFESQANLRICFNHPQREDLYNFIIRIDEKQSWKKSIKLLFQFLGLN